MQELKHKAERSLERKKKTSPPKNQQKNQQNLRSGFGTTTSQIPFSEVKLSNAAPLLGCRMEVVLEAAPGAARPKKPTQPYLKRGEGVERRVFAPKYRKPATPGHHLQDTCQESDQQGGSRRSFSGRGRTGYQSDEDYGGELMVAETSLMDIAHPTTQGTQRAPQPEDNLNWQIQQAEQVLCVCMGALA